MTDLAIAARIAETLGETETVPCAQIRRAVQTLGPARAQAFVDAALEIEANGGMLLPDSSRRRTLGGLFFHLVRSETSAAERLAIFPPKRKQPKPQALDNLSHLAAASQHAQPQASVPVADVETTPSPPKISQFWLDLAAGKPLSWRWQSKEQARHADR